MQDLTLELHNPAQVRGAGLELLAAKAALDLVPVEDIPDAAAAALEEGLDSPALRVLAGLSSTEIDEVRPWFNRALAELNVPIPSPHDAAMRLAREIAAKVVDGTIPPYQGAKQIWEFTLRVPNPEELSELDSFVYAASEWEDRPEDRDCFDEGIVRAAQELFVT